MSIEKNKYRNFKQIVNLFYNEALEDLDDTQENNAEEGEHRIKIEPKFIEDKVDGKIKIEVFIGTITMYKIKRLSDFYDRMLANENYKYGDNLEFVHNRSAFKDECLPMLDFVLKYAEIIKYGNTNSDSNYRFGASALCESTIVLDAVAFDEIFEILKGKTAKYESNSAETRIKFEMRNPEIKFNLEKTGATEYTLVPNTDLFKINIIKGNKYTYLLICDTLYRCDKKFEKTTLELIEVLRKNYLPQLKLQTKDLPQLFSIIVPKMQGKIQVKEENQEEVKKYLPKKLISRIYLDFDKNNYLIADLKFVYDDIEYNPLEDKIKEQKNRNAIEETSALNMLRKTGFMLDIKNSRFVLTNDDKIFEFVTEDITEYTKKFEVLVTDNFKTKQIKQPKISSLGVKIENNLLELDLKSLNIDTKELEKIMEKYKLKKKFHRLKDGTFLSLEDNQDIEFLDKLITGVDVDFEELNNGVIHMPVYRTMYLDQLLAGLPDTSVQENDSYNKIVNKLNKKTASSEIVVPPELNSTLRYYQKNGFRWLKALDNYHFGGILADDMGLGKTIQLLAIIMSYIDAVSKPNRRASLVVSPSSLALNWKSEAKKFVPDLRTLVISGSAYERKQQIENINNYDLVITSYDLLKRDIEVYDEQKYKFRYVIADEAQYLKNSNTQNATAIKQIQADTRYALTGTPMENSLSELWSIFDFIMPGYLFSYKKFKTLYEIPIAKDKDRVTMEKLKMLIEPFVLRRTKKEVLTELPEKTVTVLTSDMKEEQKNIYISYLAEARKEVQEAINIDGLGKSHMKILAVLTRLRQICCHPSVFIENYEGGSSKLDQCMELIKNGVDSGHKILLFSGYTSMFPIIEKELRKCNIDYFKLTGATKISERVGLVDEFNTNKHVKVFLISLKAGGTGLNLTGADMVIHYDPWWNASAENQATDRAYRIGQKNNVQVYKLITKDSIEEKIYELQKNKSALIDNMLDINTSFVNKLSKDEIMRLFD